jgi:hypothetical protein
MSVLLLLGLSRAAWPAVCAMPPALAADFHPAEARYAVAMGAYRRLVANHSAEEQRVYQEETREYQHASPVWANGERNINSRYGQLKQLQGGKLTNDQIELYHREFDALGPDPVVPERFPVYRLQAVVGDLLVDIAAHAMLVGSWEATGFDMTDAALVFGDVGNGPARVFTATRNALVTAGQSVCPRGAIPSRAVFVQLYEALSVWNATAPAPPASPASPANKAVWIDALPGDEY